MTSPSPAPKNFPFQPDPDLVLQGYCWNTTEPVRATVILVHGLGDHARRYDHLGERLNAAGYKLVAWDQRGHGPGAERKGDFGAGGWLGMVEDLRKLVDAVEDGPVILLGHSMGSMLVHHFLTLYSERVAGAVLSGNPGVAPWLQTRFLLFITWFERLRKGRNNYSEIIRYVMFGASNRPFQTENGTDFEWLTRDRAEIDKYVADPDCGIIPTCGSAADWMRRYAGSLASEAINSIRTDLPVYVFSGADDPLHNRLRNIEGLVAAYRNAGLDVQVRFYPGGRHEMFFETNRDEVIDDVLAWLDDCLGGGVDNPTLVGKTWTDTFPGAAG